MTDTLLANSNGSTSIYCHPLEQSHEKIIIKILRKIEFLFLYVFKKRRENNYIKQYLE